MIAAEHGRDLEARRFLLRRRGPWAQREANGQHAKYGESPRHQLLTFVALGLSRRFCRQITFSPASQYTGGGDASAPVGDNAIENEHAENYILLYGIICVRNRSRVIILHSQGRAI